MINGFYELSKASGTNTPYLYIRNLSMLRADPLLREVLATALNRISSMEMDSDEGIPQIDGATQGYVTQVKGRDGVFHSVKIIKKLLRFKYQYEIRYNTEYYKVRITFFTIPRKCFVGNRDSISLGFLIDKTKFNGKEAESFLDDLVTEASSIRSDLDRYNFNNWIEED